MKRFNSIFLGLVITALFSVSANAKTIVISDIDDTIKLAYTLGGVKGYYQFLKKIPFYEMRDVFNEIKDYESNGIIEPMDEFNSNISYFYVSAAPRFTFNGTEWIGKNNFPMGPVLLKTSDNNGPTYSYKYNNMKAIILDQQKRFGDVKVLFFGDNSQHDAQVYVDLTKNMNLDSEIFIRDVATNAQDIDSKLKIVRLPGVQYFFSEIELRDFPYFHFLSNDLIARIQKKFNSKTLIPDYVRETLAERFEDLCKGKSAFKADDVLSRCSDSGKASARAFFNEYYSRY